MNTAVPNCVDWRAIDASIDEETRRTGMTVPEKHTPLNADGSVPLSLQVSIPVVSALGQPPSPEFLSLIHGLLDVRVTHRLGNLFCRDDFSSHAFFVRYGYGYKSLEDMLSISPPFRPTPPLLRNELGKKHGTQLSRPIAKGESADSSSVMSITPALRETLSKYVYPSRDKLPTSIHHSGTPSPASLFPLSLAREVYHYHF